MAALEALERAEQELKILLKETRPLICIEKKSPRDHLSDALARCQAAIRSLLKSGLVR